VRDHSETASIHRSPICHARIRLASTKRLFSRDNVHREHRLIERGRR
jgi:hypothetical protein